MPKRWFQRVEIQASVVGAVIAGAMALLAAMVGRQEAKAPESPAPVEERHAPIQPPSAGDLIEIKATNANADEEREAVETGTTAHAIQPPARNPNAADVEQKGQNKNSPPRSRSLEIPTNFTVHRSHPYVLPELETTIAVSFELLEGISYATISIASGDRTLVREPLLSAGRTIPFTTKLGDYSLGVLNIDWESQVVDCQISETAETYNDDTHTQ